LSDHAQQLFTFKRGKPFAQRQILLDLDPLVEPYLSELVHRRPQTWQPDIEQIYQLYEQIGRADLLAAIALATEARCFGSEYLQAIVQSTPEGLTSPRLPLLSLDRISPIMSLETMLKSLGLTTICRELPTLIPIAEREAWSYQQLLERLLV
jgi:hypothetical protein